MPIGKFDHYSVRTLDVEASRKFYTEIMGFKKVRRNPHMVFMRSGKDLFVLTKSEKPVDPNPGDDNAIHTAFLVDGTEYKTSLDFLKSKGIKIIQDEERRKPSQGAKRSHVGVTSTSRRCGGLTDAARYGTVGLGGLAGLLPFMRGRGPFPTSSTSFSM